MSLVQKGIKSIYNLQNTLNDLQLQIDNIIILSTTEPVGASESDLWYNTDSKVLSMYKETFLGSTVFEWVPFLFNNDVIDGGNW